MMLLSTMRSHLAGLTSKSFHHARTFSTSPNLSIGHNKHAEAFYGDTPTFRSPEIVTAQGLRKVNKFVADRAAASLKDKDAYNCTLEFMQNLLNELPVVEGQSMESQGRAAKEIIEHEQRLALIRAGISVSRIQDLLSIYEERTFMTDMLKQDEWLTIVQAHPFLDIVNNYFRIPSKEDPKAFEARLRASGLVGDKFEVLPRNADLIWKFFVEKGGDVKCM
jgi:hypothetical protein